MIASLHSASEVLKAVSHDLQTDERLPEEDCQLVFDAENANLDEGARSNAMPEVNFAVALRCQRTRPPAASGSFASVIEEFVEVMHSYFGDFFSRRAQWIAAMHCSDEANNLVTESREATEFGHKLKPMVYQEQIHTSSKHGPRGKTRRGAAGGFYTANPVSRDASSVAKSTLSAAEQAQELACLGLPLPAPHVECARRAIDDAGSALLATPPGIAPGARLRWSEAAISSQFAPLAHFEMALSNIARRIHQHDVALLTDIEPPSFECMRIVAAVNWVVRPDCETDCNWLEIRKRLADPGRFVETLAAWSPVRAAHAEGQLPLTTRLSRAQSLLLELWDWAVHRSDGNDVLTMLYNWVALAASLSPLLPLVRRLTPAYEAIRTGVQRASAAAAGSARAKAEADAWAVARKSLECPDDPWWWLGLIRREVTLKPLWASVVKNEPMDDEMAYRSSLLQESEKQPVEACTTRQEELAARKSILRANLLDIRRASLSPKSATARRSLANRPRMSRVELLMLAEQSQTGRPRFASSTYPMGDEKMGGVVTERPAALDSELFANENIAFRVRRNLMRCSTAPPDVIDRASESARNQKASSSALAQIDLTAGNSKEAQASVTSASPSADAEDKESIGVAADRRSERSKMLGSLMQGLGSSSSIDDLGAAFGKVSLAMNPLLATLTANEPAVASGGSVCE